MLSPLRNRFGIPGVISVIALVFAMLGGAYAANNDSGSGKATASAKGKQGPRGPKGKTGPAGPVGPVGPAGAAGRDGLNGLDGLDGEDGKNGTNGTNGFDGADGTSVANTAEPAGANCAEGGTKLVGTSTTYACNGQKGAKGDKGSPWTDLGVLPPGETETGAWVLGPLPTVTCTVPETECTTTVQGETELSIAHSQISFPIPLPAPLEDANVHYVKEDGTSEPPTTACEGSPADPEADPGHLCVYTTDVTGPPFVFISVNKLSVNGRGADTAGADIASILTAPGSLARGTWAVTAPTTP
jgi:collagen triple helix repeat protein